MSWMETFGEDHPQYWDGQNQRAQGHEQQFRVDLVNVWSYNQTGGFHSLQQIVDCELRGDWSKGGYT